MRVNLYQPFSLLITISLVYFPISFCEESEQYLSCGKLFHCGSLQNVGYPFYGGGRTVQCGHPGFELNCEKNVPYITIQKVTYRVLAVHNTTRSLSIARDDLWNNICPTPLYNTSLDFDIFDYDTNERNITLYYGCSTIPGQPYEPPNWFGCFNDTTCFGVYLPTDENFSKYFGMVRCIDSIIVPVNERAAEDLIDLKASVDELKTALTSGFALKWSANNKYCDQCAQGGGRCGYDPSSQSFVCYCIDGRYAFTCNNTQTGSATSRNKKPLRIGLGVAGAVVAGLGIGFSIIFIYRQRRKKVVAQDALAIQTESKDLKTIPSNKPFITPPSNAFTKSIPPYPSPKSDLGRGSTNFGVQGSTYFGVQVFSYSDLEQATDNFHPSRELGDGGFGAVYHGTLPDGRVVAVKRLYENSFKRVEQFMNEVEILARLRHKNLVQLYGCTSKKSPGLLLVYEFIPNGTVADHLHGKRANSGLLSWSIRMNIAVQTAEALAYLHASDIIHRDVKTTNILLDNGFHVKVADFGLSRLFPTDVTHVSTAPQGTPGYVDPEYYQCYQLTEKSDVYSFGVVLIELISSLEAVDTNRHRQDINLANMAINKVQNHALNELVDPTLGFETNSSVRRMATQVAELAFRCLQQERDARPSMQEVLEALRGFQNVELNAQKAEVVEIVVDDVALLKGHIDTPSTDSVDTGKGVNSSTSDSI